MTPFQKKLILGLFILALLSPLGIVIPELFKAGDAWGEWSLETIERMIGYRPRGMARDAELWKAPLPDYNLGNDESSLTVKALSYVAAGLAGVGILLVMAIGVRRVLEKRSDK